MIVLRTKHASYFLTFRGVSLRYARHTAYGSVEKVFRRVLILGALPSVCRYAPNTKETARIKNVIDTPIKFFSKIVKKSI